MKARAFSLAALAALAACTPRVERLDQATMIEGLVFRVKLVRYFEHVPLHFKGEVYRVQCASPRTQGSPAGEMQEAGWVTLASGAALDSRSAAEVLARIRPRYVVVDDNTLAWSNGTFGITFDACGTRRYWSPASLPKDWLAPEKGEPRPQFSDIRVTPDGHVQFTLRSPVIKDGKAVRVQSDDFGKTWRADLL